MGINPALLIGGAEMLNNMRGGGGQVAAAPAGAPDGAAPAKPADQMGQLRLQGRAARMKRSGRTSCRSRRASASRRPSLVLFNGVTSSACGGAQSAMGPFYCPLDRKIYLDTSFFRDMEQRFGGGGDFAYAYVISHEMGHHIENQLGILPKVQRAQQSGVEPRRGQCPLGPRRADGRLPRRRLGRQRAIRIGSFLKPGDVEKAIASAQAIGDDRLQKPVARLCGARQLHAWLGGAAGGMAAEGVEVGASGQLQHVFGAEVARINY